MAYVITESCVGVKDASCVVVCPVECIITTDTDPFMIIDPNECIDCGACIPECPVNAIYTEDTVPAGQEVWTELNRDYLALARDDFAAKYGATLAAAQEKNRTSPHANAALYA